MQIQCIPKEKSHAKQTDIELEMIFYRLPIWYQNSLKVKK